MKKLLTSRYQSIINKEETYFKKYKSIDIYNKRW